MLKIIDDSQVVLRSTEHTNLWLGNNPWWTSSILSLPRSSVFDNESDNFEEILLSNHTSAQKNKDSHDLVNVTKLKLVNNSAREPSTHPMSKLESDVIINLPIGPLSNGDAKANKNLQFIPLSLRIKNSLNRKKKDVYILEGIENLLDQCHLKDNGVTREPFCSKEFNSNQKNSIHSLKSSIKSKQGKNQSQETKPKKVTFNEIVEIRFTFSSSDYNRHIDPTITSYQISSTLGLVSLIKRELNEFKLTMEVHPESKKHTHFYQG